MDGVSILLDGVCKELPPYLGTPEEIQTTLAEQLPDALMFSHRHEDHYDETFARTYADKTLRPVCGPELSHLEAGIIVGGVKILAVPSRHIGKTNVMHNSFVIVGSQCVWFLGDAAPSEFKGREDLPKPDVVIAPYAYATTPAAWKITTALGAKAVVLVHLPRREEDPYGLWKAVQETAGKCVIIPEMGERLTL